VSTTAPVLQVSTEIPLGLPDIDLTRAVVGVDEFATTRGGTMIGASTGVPGGTGVVDGSGAWLAEQVDKPVVMLPGSPSPTYPEALRAAGVNGTVLVEFVVDTLGRVESGTGRVISADHEQFALSARAVLSRLRFLPAHAQGRKVRQLVRLPFRFNLNS
jgi:protein TonB